MNFELYTYQQAVMKHAEFMKGMYLTTCENLPNCKYCYSDLIKDLYWNYAINVKNNCIKEATDFANKIKRKPAFYVLPWDCFNTKVMEKKYEEVWMFYNENKKITVKQDIREVKTKKDIETLINIFNEAYSSGVYGTIPKEYSIALKNSFETNDLTKTAKHFIVYLDEKPVGCATLIYDGEYAGIYGIGTIPPARGRGIGTSLTMHCVNYALEHGNKIIFLQTEKNSYNEKFYKRLGFSTIFTGKCYSLK